LIPSCHLLHTSDTLRLLHRSVSFEACHAIVRALVHSKLDYCDAVLANAPQSLLARLQSVLRSAAHAVLRCPRRAGLTQLIRERLYTGCRCQRESRLSWLLWLTNASVDGRRITWPECVLVLSQWKPRLVFVLQLPPNCYSRLLIQSRLAGVVFTWLAQLPGTLSRQAVTHDRHVNVIV